MKPINLPKTLDGFVLLNKPQGITSSQACLKVKRLLHAHKAGHTGTLDPLATGLLPIALGEATKFSQYLLNGNKSYTVTAKLGMRTTTGDSEGTVLEKKPIPKLSKDLLLPILQGFLGTITQTPPMYSAIKHQGTPLYKLARQGVVVDRKSRTVQILWLNLVKFTEDSLYLDVGCSKGTYIRSLVESIGETLGCGAYATDLHRYGLESLNHSLTMVTLEELTSILAGDTIEKFMVPIPLMLGHFPLLLLNEREASSIKKGQRFIVSTNLKPSMVRLMENESFLGVGQLHENNLLAPIRLMKPVNV